MLGSPSKSAGVPFGRPLVAADFDHDHKPDGAVLFNSGRAQDLNSFRIELHLTSGDDTTLTFESTEDSPAMSVVDVNGDGASDTLLNNLSLISICKCG